MASLWKALLKTVHHQSVVTGAAAINGIGDTFHTGLAQLPAKMFYGIRMVDGARIPSQTSRKSSSCRMN